MQPTRQPQVPFRYLFAFTVLLLLVSWSAVVAGVSISDHMDANPRLSR